MEFDGRDALVTGGSSGIGLAIARELARLGCHVHVAARRRDALDAALPSIIACAASPAQRFAAHPCDVSDERDVNALFETLASSPPTILINSAGVYRTGLFHEMPSGEFERLMRVNYLGTVFVTREAAPAMIERRGGSIQNVSSVAGLMGVYGMSAYGASKFAVRGFTEAIRAELAPRGVRVTLLCPPDTDTPMLLEDEHSPAATTALSRTAGLLTAEEVARAAIRGLRRNQAVIVPGGTARLVALAHRLAPGVVERASARTIRRANRRTGLQPRRPAR